MNPSSTFDLVDDAELVELRIGLEPAFRRLRLRCLRYVLDYRHYERLLSEEDAQEIVSQAILEELLHIWGSGFGAAEVSEHLKRALNRVRARHVREARQRTSEEPGEPEPSRNEDVAAAIKYKEIARALRGYIGQAIDTLDNHDRNLLIDCYGLDRFGWAKREANKSDSGLRRPGAEKVARRRARKLFVEELHGLLADASEKGVDVDLVRSVRTYFDHALKTDSAKSGEDRRHHDRVHDTHHEHSHLGTEQRGQGRSRLGRLPGMLGHLAPERPVSVEEMNEAVRRRARAKHAREGDR